MKSSKVSDIATTVVGAFVLASLGWAIMQGQVSGWDWKIHGIWAAAGLLLVLPFRQVMKLVGELPWTGGDDEA